MLSWISSSDPWEGADGVLFIRSLNSMLTVWGLSVEQDRVPSSASQKTEKLGHEEQPRGCP